MIDREDFFCDECHMEFVIDLTLHDDITAEDVTHCPFCGNGYNNEVDMNEPNFTDEFNQYDE
tara:strand:- start:645 stop:830 length:186 start_codon:yes stop_codon:yes gene_type:complete